MKKFLLICFAILFWGAGKGQDLPYARNVVQALTAPAMWGRGYTNNGMALAANYINEQFRSLGLLPLFGEQYLQSFVYPVNTFPGKMMVKINGEPLIPGEDYLVDPGSKSIQTRTALERADSLYYVAKEVGLLVSITDRLTWSVATEQQTYTHILLKKGRLKEEPKYLEAEVESRWLDAFKAANVGGYVRGTKRPDSLLIFTAHYDHLGGMGNETFFPGANDNASGVAMLLSLAAYYRQHPAPYSVAFICFAGEEAGLLGSRFLVEHPPIDLKKIRFLVNLDMVGTGSAGGTIVNATLHPTAFQQLLQLNEKGNYLPKINARGPAPNSDHYFFTQAGVPAFFLYTQGGSAAYHDLKDRGEELEFTVYDSLFHLLIHFYGTLVPIN